MKRLSVLLFSMVVVMAASFNSAGAAVVSGFDDTIDSLIIAKKFNENSIIC